MSDLRARKQPAWIIDIAEARSRPLIMPDHSAVVPQSGDVVLKPFIDHRTFKQLFRVETSVPLYFSDTTAAERRTVA